MNPGSVFYDEEFVFHDGETGKKLFVVLGTVGPTAVVVKTTSRQHSRGTTFGCQPSDRFHNFFIPDRACYLEGNTWVCLDEFYELQTRAVLQKRFDGKIKPVCTIPDEILRLIQDCALISLDISTDQHRLVTACLVECGAAPTVQAAARP